MKWSEWTEWTHHSLWWLLSAVWLQSTPARSVLGDERDLSQRSASPLCTHNTARRGRPKHRLLHLGLFIYLWQSGSQLGAKPQLQFTVIKSENLPSSNHWVENIAFLNFNSLFNRKIYISLERFLVAVTDLQSETSSQHNQMLNTTLFWVWCEGECWPAPSPSQREIN